MYIEHACLVLSKRLHLQTIFLTQQNKLRITACFFCLHKLQYVLIEPDITPTPLFCLVCGDAVSHFFEIFSKSKCPVNKL